MRAETVPGVDPQAISAWLGDRLGAQIPLHFRQLGSGKSNLTYRVDDAAGNTWVLRRPPLGPLLPSAHDVAREHDVMRRLERTDVPVPRIGLVRDPAVSDAPVVVMEHVDALVLDTREAIDRTPSPRQRAIGLSMAETLARIHEVDLDAIGLSDLASRKPYAERQLRRWLRQWEASRTRDAPVVGEVAHRLRLGAPTQRETTLVHSDYHLLNVVAARADGAVRAVLDWELCTLGDPLADVGGLLAYWSEGDGDPISSVTRVVLGAGFPRRDELLEAYAATCDRDISAVGYWQAMAYWKIAIIAEGVRRRRLDEPEDGEPIAAAAIDALIDRARDIADAVGV